MYTASVTVNLTGGGRVVSPNELYYGSVSSTNISSYLGSATFSLPSRMHGGSSVKTYITATQLDNGSTTRSRLSFSYSIAANCQSATIYFRDVTSSLANGTSVSIGFIAIQDKA